MRKIDLLMILDQTNNTPDPETLKWITIISIIVCAVIGIGFFIGSCIYHVKKDAVIIVEKMNEYYGTFPSGWHWFWPFAYRRVGYYPIHGKKEFRLNNGKKAVVKYTMVDPKKYHYGKISVPDFINKITLSEEKVTFEFLQVNLQQIGIELNDIHEII